MSKRILAVMMAFVMLFSCMPVFAHAEEVTPAASGTTYYVSSLNGADGNNGTSESTPFRSLLKINEITLQPSDRVLLERGSVFVDEYLHVKGSGNETAPIIIDAYGDESLPKPLIQTNASEGSIWYQDYGKQLDNTWHKYQGDVSSCILLYDVEYIEISNIAMTNEGNFAEGEVYNTYGRMDRTGVAGIAENIGTVDHIYLRNLEIRNVQGSVHDKHMANGGIYLLCHNPDNETATGVARFDDVLIEGCRLDEVNRWGIAVGYTAYWDHFPYGSSIDADVCKTYGSTNVVIRNNYLTNIGGDGITTMYCYQPLIEYNVLDGYCQDMTLEIYGNNNQRVAAGIWPWMCKTPYLQYNEAYNSTPCPDAQAWDADWGDNAIYQYNYSCNNAGGAVMFCGQYACNTVFRYNISQNDLDGVLNLAGSPNGEIYNNVFYIKEGVKINRTGMSGGVGNTVSNNIFYYTGSTPANATYGNWGDITAEWNSNIYYNYETTPDDPNAITADPLFVDPGKGPTGAQESGLVHDISAFEGYKLQPGSPAIDAGTPIADNGGRDFFGNELDLIPDIGVYDAGTLDSDAARAVVVNVELGESVTLTDLTGDYSDTTPVVDDGKIASVVLSSKEGSAQTAVSSTAATSLKSGSDYMICNTNTGSAITNVMVDAPAWGTRALQLTADKTLSDQTTWTLEADGSGYKLKSADSSYLSINLNASSLGSGDTFTAATYGSSNVWTFLDSNGYYLDNLGRMDFLGGWTEIGNSSTWNLYEIVTTTLDAATELTFTGLYPGTTNILVGDTLYLVRVGGKLQEVELEVGETATFSDDTGNYVGADTSALDENVATVELSGLMTDDYSLGGKVTSLTSGGKYILVNTRSGKPVTNLPTSGNGASAGLLLSGAAADAEKAAIWTITGSNGSYTVQDLDGSYMTVSDSSAAMSGSAASLTLNYNGSNWTISSNGAYLNHFGGSGSTVAAGWDGDGSYDASTDAGSLWDIYQVNAGTNENGTTITFTAVGGGETHVQIGDTMYHIVVTGSAHGFVNGFCDHCSEYEPADLVDGVYEIGNAGQLYWFASQVDRGELDADAVLTADITVNQDGEERKWNAIGANSKKYAGIFDGQGYTVSGLYYNNDSTVAGYIGLIASLDEGGVVKNVTVADSYLCGYRYIGAIVGQNYGGTVENCHNDGTTVTGSSSNIGGIAGGSSGIVTGCSNSGEISSDAGNNIGGIVGGNSGIVELCFNTGAVLSDCCSDEHCVGGIVGENMSGTIRNCYNTGSVSNKGAASGGIVGKSDQGTIESCHNVGTVSGKQDVGGIIGKSYNDPITANCYFLSDETAAQFASGEIAYLLNGSTSEGELVWKQTIGTDAYPTFEGATVYYDSETGTYSNKAGGDTHEHSFGDWTVTTEPTCTDKGVETRSCACGETETREVPALDHD
ncbi:MAG: right-handed parallel beta-helix repeat-containing protein, partial [Oscillospiraceae bacterium]|nr:right-handed parallel beta-helix repeat-containing protein [Oscillospiraceae bacterium]